MAVDNYSGILRFRNICTDHGINALSFLAVLCRIESGDSCRKVATSLGMATATAWRAARGLENQGLLTINSVPHPGGTGTRFMLQLSERGEKLVAELNAILREHVD